MRSTRSPGCGCPSTGTDCGGWRRVGDTPAARRAAESGSLQRWAFAPLVVSAAGVPHADSLRFLELLSSQMVQAIGAQRAGVDVDGVGRRHGGERPADAGCGPRAPQGGVLPRRDEGWVSACVRGPPGRGRGGGAPGLGRGPPGRGRGAGSSVSVAFAAPVVQAVAVSGGRWVVCGRAGRCRVRRLPAVGFSRSGLWSFPVLGVFACLSVWFGRMIPGLYEVIQYTLSHT